MLRTREHGRVVWLHLAFEDEPAVNCCRMAVFLGCLELPSEILLEASSFLAVVKYLIMAFGLMSFQSRLPKLIPSGPPV